MTLVPAALFVLAAVPRAVYLFRAENKTKRQAVYTSKLVSIISHANNVASP